MAQTLRDYQRDGLSRVLTAYREGARSVLMTLPTGGGKTTVFGKLIETFLGRSTSARALVLVHRRELAVQAAKRLREFGVDFGYVMAGVPGRPYARTQVASVQTLARRAAPAADLIICDEAHLSTAETWTRILSKYPRARILGCTATPWRLAGKPLIGAYDASVVVATPAELREQGFLSPYNGFSYDVPDFSGVKCAGGDYNERQSAEVMRSPGIVGNVVEQWKAHASDLSTVVFNVTVEHSLQVAEKFRAAGIRVEHLDGSTGSEQRRAILKRVASGETQVLCNVGIAVEGLDIPRLKCCVLNRPTMSLARAIQMMGRVRRPWNGVTARIHDHAFLIRQHGLPDAQRDYSLHAKAVDLDNAPPPLHTCSKCKAIYEGPRCTACDYVPDNVERKIEEITDAKLVEFSSSTEPKPDRGPPVVVTWNQIGRAIEGVFQKQLSEDTAWGKRNRYIVAGKRRDYSIPGTSVLDSKMRAVKVGDSIRVTYTGESMLPGDRSRKEFKLERDEPDPEVIEVIEGPEADPLILAVNAFVLAGALVAPRNTNTLSPGVVFKEAFVLHQARLASNLGSQVAGGSLAAAKFYDAFEQVSGLCRAGAESGFFGSGIYYSADVADSFSCSECSWREASAALIRAGKPFSEISKTLGKDVQTIRDWATDEAVNQTHAGVSTHDVATDLKLGESTIRGWLTERGDYETTAPNKRKPDDMRQAAIDRHRAGASARAVAAELKISPNTVKNILIEAGYYTPDVKRRPKAISEETKAMACQRNAAGESLRRIAKSIGVDASTVRGWISSRATACV